MRTYEDVKSTLAKYRAALEKENQGVRKHYVIIGGNMSIVRNGTSNRYILGKGDPVPMVKETADKNLPIYQKKCSDDITLKCVKYADWLTSTIDGCEKLITCIQRQMVGEPEAPMTTPEPEISKQETPEPEAPDTTNEYIHRTVTELSISAGECPISNHQCTYCRFFQGLDVSVFPFQIICSLNSL